MTARNLGELAKHINHAVRVVGYGLKGKRPWQSVCVECETCQEVLVEMKK
jgi:hypothetical protein